MSEIHTSDNEFNDIALRNYSKITEATKKSGYKDGAYDGRQSVFQSSFDIGYEHGFQAAFEIGKYKGITMAVATLPVDKQSEQIKNCLELAQKDMILKNATRGQCQICMDTSLLDRNVNEISSIQLKHTEKIENTLKQRYDNVLPFKRSD